MVLQQCQLSGVQAVWGGPACQSCGMTDGHLQVAAVLEYATHNAVEPFLEPVLELASTIMQRDAMEVGQPTHGTAHVPRPLSHACSLGS